MLGHKLWQTLHRDFDVWVTGRAPFARYERFGLFARDRFIEGVDAMNLSTVAAALERVRPDAVINCIGVIKQLAAAKDPIASLTLNSLFPHQVARMLGGGARLLHVSTDCVFSGRRGMYRESDVPDPEDLYGRTKLLGEVDGPHCLTLRTSIVGRELETASGLFEWFLGNRGGRVRGFSKAIYSGLTTLALSRVIAEVLDHHRGLRGVYQVASQPLSKLELLRRVRDALGLQVELVPDDSVAIDRSLDGSHFRVATSIEVPSWDEMISDFAADPTPYDAWKRHAPAVR
jgi:dTDP-4-dehydrorhamnose reductase